MVVITQSAYSSENQTAAVCQNYVFSDLIFTRSQGQIHSKTLSNYCHQTINSTAKDHTIKKGIYNHGEMIGESWEKHLNMNNELLLNTTQ